MMYLYVKTHNVTGLKYLGKTIRKDYHSYPGSGRRWINHLNKHGFDYSTSILLCTEDKSELVETGKFFSKLWNVVHSDEWANMRPEEGDGGDTSVYVDHVKRGKSISKIKNSEQWKETQGVIISEKAKARWADNTFKESISNKISQTQRDLEWKKKHYKECNCSRRLISPGNYKKHTKKCRLPEPITFGECHDC